MILYINACVRRESRTKKLADQLLEKLTGSVTEAKQGGPVTELKLEDIDFPKVDQSFLNKRDRLIAEGRFDADEFRLARQFAEADGIVIAAPFWDLSFPAALKAYFEQINVLGVTFVYTPEGVPKGLCKAKKLYYVTTAGGTFFPEEFGFGYVKALAQNFYGIQDVELIKAVGLDIDTADAEEILKEASQRYFGDKRDTIKDNMEPSPAERLSAEMGLGFNLGNSLDAIARPGSPLTGINSELAWFNPRTTREMIAAIKKAGFKTLRLPVTWHNHVVDTVVTEGITEKSNNAGTEETTDKIDPAWMNRVKEVVKWCIAEDLYVILDTHHDICEGFLLPDNSHIDRAIEFIRNVWRQIAYEMRDIPADRLLFESMNEIRVPKASYEWTPDYDDPDCRAAMENVNRLNQVFLDTVRAAGKENAERFLVIPGYSTSTEGVCWDGFRLPKDTVEGHLIVAAHVYAPAHFAFYLKDGANITEFNTESRESTDPIDERLTKLYNRFIVNHVPVNIDEFGTVDKDNDADRIRCLGYTLAKASELKIRCCYWDNGVFKSYGSGMAIFDRDKCIFPDPKPVEEMLGAMIKNN